jgi:hypothetical protein
MWQRSGGAAIQLGRHQKEGSGPDSLFELVSQAFQFGNPLKISHLTREWGTNKLEEFLK